MKQILTAIALIGLVAPGCNCSGDRTRTHSTGGQTSTNVEVSGGLHANDLALDLVHEALKSGRVGDPAALQEFINGENPVVNNVDADSDGQIDPIRVVPLDGNKMDLIACLTSKDVNRCGNVEDPVGSGLGVTVAQVGVTVNSSSGQVEVYAGYSPYVGGSSDYYYHYHAPRSSFASGLVAGYIAGRIFAPRPVAFYGGHYAPRRVYEPSRISSSRTSYTTSRNINKTTVTPTKRPSSFNVASAKKSNPKFAKPARASSSARLSDRKGQVKDFKKRDAAKPKQRASGFGAKKSKPKKSGWGSGGQPKVPNPKPKKSGWGSSAGSKKKSSGSSWFGGSSGSKKSGWGSSTHGAP